MFRNFPLSFFHFPFRKRFAFTLIELLMVVAILGLVMVAITQLLARVISSSGKSAATQSVKENGQFAISTMEKTVRKAKSVGCSGTPLSGIVTAIVPETAGDVTYTFARSGTTLAKTVNPPNPPNSTSGLTDPNIQVGSFSCALTPATSTASATVSIELIIGSQIFSTQVSPRVY